MSIGEVDFCLRATSCYPELCYGYTAMSYYLLLFQYLKNPNRKQLVTKQEEWYEDSRVAGHFWRKPKPYQEQQDVPDTAHVRGMAHRQQPWASGKPIYYSARFLLNATTTRSCRNSFCTFLRMSKVNIMPGTK